MASFLQDLRYTLRHLLRSPGFALIAIFTLALGIGANSAIFSVVNGVLLKPLPFREPGRLMFIYSQFPALGFERFWMSPPEYFEYQEDSRAFAQIGAYRTGAVNVSGSDEPQRVSAVFMTVEMFEVLGAEPIEGQAFTAEDDQPGGNRVILLSHAFWQRSFGGDKGLVGALVDVDGLRSRVVGVMPPDFDLGGAGADAWLPLQLDRKERRNRSSHSLYLVGRLAEGSSEAQAKAELEVLLQRWEENHPGDHRFEPNLHTLSMMPLQEEAVGDIRPALWMLLGTVGFVLLIACANVANLLLVRAEARRKEIAVRASLGAGRARLLRQFLTEGVVLSALGGIAGVLVANWGMRLLLSIHPESLPRVAEVGLDAQVLGFTGLITVATGLLFGLAPAFHLSTRNLNDTIREGGQRSTAGSARHRLRKALVVAEVALAVVLVIGAGLMLRSFSKLLTVDAGFDPKGILTFQIFPPRATYAQRPSLVTFYERLLDRLEALPGVEAVAAMSGLPPNRPVDANDTDFEGLEPPPPNQPRNVDFWQFVTPGYFATLGIPMVEGEPFSKGAAEGAPRVALVNETTAQHFWSGFSPIGQQVRSHVPNMPWLSVIGVVKDVKQRGLSSPVGTEIYFPYAQSITGMPHTPREMYVAVRSKLPPPSVIAAVRYEVNQIDPGLPIAEVRTMEEVFGESIARERFLTWLLVIFGSVALLLAAVGTYGVLAYTVAERRREIGIRMALGAQAGEVVQLLLKQGLTVVAIGLALGVFLSLALSTVLSYSFFGIESSDPLTFAAVVIFIGLVAATACFLPARKAARVDPVEVLRDE